MGRKRDNKRTGSRSGSSWSALIVLLPTLLFGLGTIAGSVIPGSDLFAFSVDNDGNGGTSNLFQLADFAAGLTPDIYVDPNDWPGVLRVADDLATDFGRVLGGLNATVVTGDWNWLGENSTGSGNNNSTARSRPAIVLGTLGRSSLLDGLAATSRGGGGGGGLDPTVFPSIQGKWETYTYQVVDKPWPGQAAAFVIAGSDRRGAVFGAYGVSEQIGVSPWYWWADVPSTQRTAIYVRRRGHATADNEDGSQTTAARRVFGPPSVKYRGIFFNDESPCLTGWGHATFKDSQYGSPFVAAFYRRVFELILRLRGNYLWPAMWSSMFYLDDAANGPTADLYGVFMGTSHHEPMARADKEQNRFLRGGAWDWRSNKAGVQAFMREGAARSRNWSTVYTLGMRGSGDAASATLTPAALEEVIGWQQATLVTELGRELAAIPQQWVMYKEVPGYWQNGKMNVSDDVTLLWSDDNRGNIQRVPLANETARRGGAGMYYHFDYVGSPRNYKWINTIQLQKTWEQMTLAHQRGVQAIWLTNVGDLKGLELPTAHIMALAWDVASFRDPDSTRQWLTEWCGRQFGPAAAANASAIMTAYGMLVARRKYEDLDMTPFAFSTANYDEAERNYDAWAQLAAHAQAVYDHSVPAAAQAAFFELVLHPVLAGKTVVEIYTKTALGSKYAGEHRASTNDLAAAVQAAFAADKALKTRYHTLLNGKWNHVMDQVHLGYTSWQDPSTDTIPRLSYLGGGGAGAGATSSSLLGVAVQGGTTVYPAATTLTLGTVTPYTPAASQRWLDVFLRANGTVGYQITANETYVAVSHAEGTLASPVRNGRTSDVRALVTVDWPAAPSGRSVVALTVHTDDGGGGGGGGATVLVPLDKTRVPAGFHGHVEADGVVSMEAAHHATTPTNSSYLDLPDYGRTHSGVKLGPRTPSQQPGAGPVLTYPFYTFDAVAGTAAPALTVYLSPSENANPASPNRYAFSIDGDNDDGTDTSNSNSSSSSSSSSPTQKLTVVQPVPLASAGSEPSGWSDAVTAGAYVKTTKLATALAPGPHVLRVWLLEPTMVLTKLVLDVGGLKTSALGPPESVQV
ncbi:hypothetical protein SPI_03201 [Niveomyces insectorum RCEF 264]|uniref:Gylcosyl hydrolase 115 C-terminal domain-containing protein n=1 Tax=Niveomyces insectorum RCEF 264 TaxID=1081102 RepID=A0A167X5J0_9HYPO|nr:hypothetical protein SPI_03201 [Niveomyces insectorum RCEF 264]